MTKWNEKLESDVLLYPIEGEEDFVTKEKLSKVASEEN